MTKTSSREESPHENKLGKPKKKAHTAKGKKKLMKKKKKVEEKVKTEDAGKAQAMALAYLKQWRKDKCSWKFCKVRQVWLLQNMFKPEQLPQKSFAVLLKYLEGLQGSARQKTAQDAEKYVEDTETEVSDRARAIIQLLSD